MCKSFIQIINFSQLDFSHFAMQVEIIESSTFISSHSSSSFCIVHLN